MLRTRVITALVALPLLFATIFNLKVFYIVISALALIGLFEYFHAVKAGNVRPMELIGIISGMAMLIMMLNGYDFDRLMPYIILTVLIVLALPVFNRGYSFIGAGVTILGIFYISFLFNYLYLIRSMDNGLYYIWFVFICSWVSDTSAYFVGMFFGKRKLCPEVSPHKTVEGSLGGMTGSIVVCVIYGLLLGANTAVKIPVIHLVMIGILGNMMSQLGDLSSSSIKRNVGIKDFGKIMPGHGGILDRFDSILFVAPLIYYYINLVL